MSFLPPAVPPLEIVRAEGSWLETADGRRVLDAAGGAIVANIGHGRREVAEAAARELERVTYVIPPWKTASRDRLRDRLLSSWLPEGLTRVAFTSGGSESVDAAIRLARQHHVAGGQAERWKVVGRQVSYHGVTVGGLSVGGHDVRRRGMEPWLAAVAKAPAHYCLRCPLGLQYPTCSVACADDQAGIIEREGPETVSAFIAEPVVGAAGGALTPQAEYWPRIAEVCREYGVLLIADEVMTGFGRTGRNFAVEHWGVTPDILVGGKGLAGGYAPMGGLFATEEVVAPLTDFMFYTYGSHPASCAAADKVLEIMEREGLVERAARLGALLAQRLAGLAEHPHVAEVRGLGLLHGVELVADRASLEPFPAPRAMARKVSAAALDRGVWLYPAGSGSPRDAVLIGPPFVVTEGEIDLIVSVLTEAIDAAAAAN